MVDKETIGKAQESIEEFTSALDDASESFKNYCESMLSLTDKEDVKRKGSYLIADTILAFHRSATAKKHLEEFMSLILKSPIAQFLKEETGVDLFEADGLTREKLLRAATNILLNTKEEEKGKVFSKIEDAEAQPCCGEVISIEFKDENEALNTLKSLFEGEEGEAMCVILRKSTDPTSVRVVDGRLVQEIKLEAFLTDDPYDSEYLPVAERLNADVHCFTWRSKDGKEE